MSNTVYLSTTNADRYPGEEEAAHFFQTSGTEYAAKACIPLFWLCLYAVEDIRLVPANASGFDDDQREFAYLMADRQTAIGRATRRLDLMRNALGDKRSALFEEWIARLGNESHKNVLTRTEQLDCMEQEGALEVKLKRALAHLDQPSQRTQFRLSETMRDICGLWSDEELGDCESMELVGSTLFPTRWPQPFTPVTRKMPAQASRPWWRFWK